MQSVRSFPCERLLQVVGVDEGLDSFISHLPMLPNLEKVRELGLEAHLREQLERKALLEELIANYNEGRSTTRFCLAAALLTISSIRQAIGELSELVSSGELEPADRKTLANHMRRILDEQAHQQGVVLRLRRKKLSR